MDLFPVLQNAFLVFGTIVVTFLFGSFFAYKHKKIKENRSLENFPLAVNNASGYNTQVRDSIVHTIAIPEIGAIPNEYNRKTVPFQNNTKSDIPRRTNYEILNNFGSSPRKTKMDPYTLFR